MVALGTIPPMPLRVVAFLLALVLSWSGLDAIEAPRAFAQAASAQSHAHAEGPAAAHEGSLAHHHLDDLHSQALGDLQTEPPALLPPPLTPGAAPAVMARPHNVASAEAGPPFLAGPLRPPCSAALAG